MQNESVNQLNAVAAFFVAVSALAIVMRLLIPANSAVSPVDSFAPEEAIAPTPFRQPPAQARQFRLLNFALGDRLENDRLIGRIAADATLANPQDVVLRWEYSGAQIGDKIECLQRREGEPETSNGTLNLQYVNGFVNCYSSLDRPGRYRLRVTFVGQEILSTNLSISEPRIDSVQDEQPQPTAPAGRAAKRGGPKTRDAEALKATRQILCTVPGPGGAPPRDIRMTVSECEAAAGLVN